MEAELDPKSLWSISYGIFIVTTVFEGKNNGQLCNTVIQVSADPPRVAMALNKENYTHELLDKSGVFAVSVLEENTPMDFIGKFGFRTGREVDKMAEVEFVQGSTGCPCVTENAVSVFEGRVFDKMDVGTHTLFAGDVVSGRVITGGKPLTYAQYHANKGVAPKAAPTYRAPETEKKGD